MSIRNRRKENMAQQAEAELKNRYAENDALHLRQTAGCLDDSSKTSLIGFGLSPMETDLINNGTAEELLTEYEWRMSHDRQHDQFVRTCSQYLYKVVGKDKQ